MGQKASLWLLSEPEVVANQYFFFLEQTRKQANVIFTSHMDGKHTYVNCVLSTMRDINI